MNNMVVVLAKLGGDIYSQDRDYIFYTRTVNEEKLSTSKVRSGTYQLYTYANDGDITDQLQVYNVEVSRSDFKHIKIISAY